MKPQLGDTLFNRYTLVTPLRDVSTLQAWKATDRVLARECQLFILSDSSRIEDIASLATAVGRKQGVTPVLQFRKAGDTAVLVTQMEQGLSLAEYLRGLASGTCSYEAIRTIIGEAAGIAAGLQEPRLNVDTIRISTNGVEIADAPIARLLAEPTHAPEGMPVEQLAIRQLALVMASLVMRAPELDIDHVDMNAMSADLPPEFKVIMSRGLELDDEHGTASEPMLTLGELTALLGEWTPLQDLSDVDLAVPSEAGNASIATAALLDTDPDFTPATLPDNVVTREKLRNLTIDHAPTEAEAAEHADRVVARQNREAFESLPADPVIAVRGPRSLWHLAAGESTIPSNGPSTGDVPLPQRRDGRQQPTVAIPRAALQRDLDATVPGDPSDLFHEFSFQTYPTPVPTPDTLGPGEETTRIPIMTDANQQTMALDVAAMRHEMAAHQHDASQAPAQPDAAGANGQATAPAFPPAGVDDATIVAADAPVAANGYAHAGNAQSYVASDLGQLPPSFVPRPAQQSDETSPTDDDLSKHRLFGNVRITAVVITVAVVLIAAALTIALVTFHNNNSNPADKGENSNQWPDQNLDDVPFGSDEGTQKQSSQNGGSTSAGEGASFIKFIDVTDAFQR